MIQTKSKAEQKRIVRLKNFLDACGLCDISPIALNAPYPSLFYAMLGAQTKKFKTAIRKAGWVKSEHKKCVREKFNRTIFTHSELKGRIEVVEFQNIHCNNICLTPK